MIHSVNIIDSTRTPVTWMSEVKALSKPREFHFKPGLNILWGRNGSGKTTLTKMLARLFHCEQSYFPVITEDSVLELAGYAWSPDRVKGVSVSHDGQGVRYFDPNHAVGLIGGMAGFDFEFLKDGCLNAVFKGSSGQTTMNRFNDVLTSIVQGKAVDIKRNISNEHVVEKWGERGKTILDFLTPNAEKGPQTIILDEPERGYDLSVQVALWRILRAYSDRFQFIVASHSVFALRIPEAAYIDLSPGYLEEAGSIVETLQAWPMSNARELVEKEVKAKCREQSVEPEIEGKEQKSKGKKKRVR